MALNIDIICANSPQAKGRIERAFGTLQDRMVKELRLAEVSSMAAANAWLPGFITAYNTRFGRYPANAKNLHRPLAQTDDLDEILAWREERTVTRNLTLHYDRMMLLLDPTSLARGLVRKKVEVVNYPDGRFAVQFNGTALGFKVFDKIQTVQPGAIVDNKRLSAVLEQVKAQQAAYPARQQRGHLARQRPPKGARSKCHHSGNLADDTALKDGPCPCRSRRHLSWCDPGSAGGQPPAPTPLRPPDQRSATRAAGPVCGRTLASRRHTPRVGTHRTSPRGPRFAFAQRMSGKRP